MGHAHLAGRADVARGAAAFLHLQGLGSLGGAGLGDLKADPADAGRQRHGGEGGSDQDLVQVGQRHQEVLTGGRLSVGPAPEFLGRGGRQQMKVRGWPCSTPTPNPCLPGTG